MITKLDQVKTAEELLTFTACFGIPTDCESICKMQDIIGHTEVGTLADLAEDDGTTIDADGHKWSTGRRGTQKELIALLFVIWNYEDATRFYNQHVNPEYKRLREEAAKVEELKKALEEQRKATAKARETAEYNLKIWEEADAEADKQKRRADAAEAEVMRLKAMLFDYMTKTA